MKIRRVFRKISIPLFVGVLSYVLLGIYYWSVQPPPHRFALPGETTPTKEFDYELKNPVEYSGEIEVFRLLPRKIDKTKFKEVANCFSMTPDDNNLLYNQYFGYDYREGNAGLSISESGKVQYTLRKTHDYKGGTLELPSDNEAVSIADAFLKRSGLLPKDFILAGVENGLVAHYSLQGQQVENKAVRYKRTVNGRNVYGVSRISVHVGESGVIEEVNVLYHDIEYLKKVPVRSVKEAFDDLKRGKGVETFGNLSNVKKCVIDKLELAYYEPSELTDQPILYPVYAMVGKVYDDKGTEGKYGGMVEAADVSGGSILGRLFPYLR